MNIGIYSTGRDDATALLNSFVPGLQTLPDVNCELLNIDQFRASGLASGFDCFVLFGILHGPGHAYKACVKNNVDFIYLDHAYFKPGYEYGWLRVTHNHHTMNWLRKSPPPPPDRWEKFFRSDSPLQEWKKNSQRDGCILLLPPTDATAWLFDEHQWADRTVRQIQSKTDRPLKIRQKPQEPTVNKDGHFTGLKTNPASDLSIDEELEDAYCVVSFNSNVAIEATRKGIPVITTKYSACYPITYSLDQLETESLNEEPDRLGLFHWLAYNQFHFTEMQNGKAWVLFFNMHGFGH